MRWDSGSAGDRRAEMRARRVMCFTSASATAAACRFTRPGWGAFGAAGALFPHAPGGYFEGTTGELGFPVDGLDHAGPCEARLPHFRLGSALRRGGSGQGRAHRGRCLDHGGQRGAAQHRAEGHGRGLPGDAGGLAQESGIETPTAEDLARLDRKRKGLSNRWVSKRPRGQDRQDEGRHDPSGLRPSTRWIWTPARWWQGRRGAGGGQGESRGRPTAEDPAECVTDKGYHSRSVLKALDDGPWKTRISEPKQKGFLARRRGGPPGSHQQPDPAVIGRGQGSLQAARRDRRALLCAQPRSRRHAPDMAARARERAQAIPAPCRRPQSESPDAQTDRRRHPAGGRGGRIWLYLRAYCASWSRSGRSDGPHRLGGWRNRLRRVMFRRRVKPGQ